MTDNALTWLDPSNGVTPIPSSAELSLAALDVYAQPLVHDTLVAQRIISVDALKIVDESIQGQNLTMGWGHTLASLIAIL